MKCQNLFFYEKFKDKIRMSSATNFAWHFKASNSCRGSALDKILSNWVIWEIYTHLFLIELGIRVFHLGTLFC